MTCSLPQASKRDYLWRKPWSTPVCSRPSFRYSNQWVGSLLWPHATRWSKSFPMRFEAVTARISVTASTADTRVRSSRLASTRTVSDPASAGDPQAEHVVPEYAPSLVPFSGPPAGIVSRTESKVRSCVLKCTPFLDRQLLRTQAHHRSASCDR